MILKQNQFSPIFLMVPLYLITLSETYRKIVINTDSDLN